MEELLMGLANVAPVVAVLVWVVVYFNGQIKKKDEEITELNKELRAAEKENLTVLMKTVAFFEKITDRLDDLKSK